MKAMTVEKGLPARQALVKALRSGKYKKGIRRLCQITPEGESLFCCLGIACEVFMESGGELQTSFKDDQKYFRLKLYQSSLDNMEWSEAGLPEAVRIWLGFRGSLADLNDNNVSGLAAANDQEDGNRYSFNDIADMIEKGLVRLQ